MVRGPLAAGCWPAERRERALTSEEKSAAHVVSDPDKEGKPRAVRSGSPAVGSGVRKDSNAKIKPDPKLWDQLAVGDVVIAPEKNAKADGYWPGVITAISKDREKLTIRWRDFPSQPPLIVKTRSVALLLDHS